jgi:hypothetical protein
MTIADIEDILLDHTRRFLRMDDRVKKLECQTSDFQMPRSASNIQIHPIPRTGKSIEEIKKWIEENHEHHLLANVESPECVDGCVDNDYPYVNSQALLKFLES